VCGRTQLAQEYDSYKRRSTPLGGRA